MTLFDEFGRMESVNWARQSLAHEYVHRFASAADQAIAPLLQAASPIQNQRILDVCCGHGNITNRLTSEGAEAIGLDFSPAMLEMARSTSTGASYILGDAQALPFSDSSFDVVVSGFGICHLPDQAMALAEVNRVLRSNGRFAMTVWCGPDKSASFEILYGAIRSFGAPSVTLPPGPDFHQFANPSIAKELFSAAGFTEIKFSIVDCYWYLSTPQELCSLFEQATARASVLLAAQPADCLDSIRAAMATAVQNQFRHESSFRVPVPVALVSGMKKM